MSMGSKRVAGPGGESLLASGAAGTAALPPPQLQSFKDAHPASESAQGTQVDPSWVPDPDSTTPLGAAGSSKGAIERDSANTRQATNFLGEFETDRKAREAAAAEEEKKKQQQSDMSMGLSVGASGESSDSGSGPGGDE